MPTPVHQDFGAFNVLQLGLDADGSTDVSARIQAYVNQVPDTRSNAAGQFPGMPPVSHNTGGTHKIVFPSSGPSGKPYRYRFDSPITVGGNKSIRFTSDGMGGAILENNSGDDAIFIMDGTNGANGVISQFDNLTMWKGGIRYEGRYRGFIETHHIHFMETPGPALRYVNGADTFSPIYMDNHHNRYFMCAGSEWIEGRQSGIVGRSWMNRHLWNTDTSMIVDGADMLIADSDFQLMERNAAPGSQYLWIRDRDEPNAFVNVVRNRFAPETSENFNGLDFSAPGSAVMCGNAQSDTDVVANINFFTNRFNGADQTDTTPGVGQYGISFLHRPFNCTVDMNNYFTNIDVAAIGEQWTNGGTLNTGQEDRNYWGWNSPSGNTIPKVFEHGGESWLQPFLRAVPNTPTNAAMYAHDTAGGLHELLEPPAAGGPATWSPTVGPF